MKLSSEVSPTMFVFEFYFHYEPGKTGGRKVRSQRRQNWYNPKLVTKLGMKGKMFAICHCGVDGSYHHCHWIQDEMVRREAVWGIADIFQLGQRPDFSSQFYHSLCDLGK